MTASGTDVTISSTSSGGDPTPYVSPGQNFSMLPSSTSTLSIEGTNFTPTSTVSIPSWAGSINSITVHSPTSMDINITSGTALGTYDIVINNGGSSNTAWSGNGQDMIEVNSVVWNDLRLG